MVRKHAANLVSNRDALGQGPSSQEEDRGPVLFNRPFSLPGVLAKEPGPVLFSALVRTVPGEPGAGPLQYPDPHPLSPITSLTRRVFKLAKSSSTARPPCLCQRRRFHHPHPPRKRTGGRFLSVLWCLASTRPQTSQAEEPVAPPPLLLCRRCSPNPVAGTQSSSQRGGARPRGNPRSPPSLENPTPEVFLGKRITHVAFYRPKPCLHQLNPGRGQSQKPHS